MPAKQFQTHKPCIVPNQEIQLDFAGPINNEKHHQIYILTCIDRVCKYPSAEMFENSNASNVIKFLDNHIQFSRSFKILEIRPSSLSPK